MLPGELLLGHVKGGVATAVQLESTPAYLEMAAEYIALFTDFDGLTRGDLDEALLELEGNETDFKVRRGLTDRKSTRLNSSHPSISRMPSSA